MKMWTVRSFGQISVAPKLSAALSNIIERPSNGSGTLVLSAALYLSASEESSHLFIVFDKQFGQPDSNQSSAAFVSWYLHTYSLKV